MIKVEHGYFFPIFVWTTLYGSLSTKFVKDLAVLVNVYISNNKVRWVRHLLLMYILIQ